MKLGRLNVEKLLKENELQYTPDHVVKRSGEYYTGQVDFNGNKSGLGRFDCQSYVFEGQWEGNKWNGYGRLLYCHGEIYDGHFVDNAFHGFGSRTHPDGLVENGYFEDTIFKGEGFKPKTDTPPKKSMKHIKFKSFKQQARVLGAKSPPPRRYHKTSLDVHSTVNPSYNKRNASPKGFKSSANLDMYGYVEPKQKAGPKVMNVRL